MHILVSVISNMIASKQISKKDDEMLLHYSLYNNDCLLRHKPEKKIPLPFARLLTLLRNHRAVYGLP